MAVAYGQGGNAPLVVLLVVQSSTHRLWSGVGEVVGDIADGGTPVRYSKLAISICFFGCVLMIGCSCCSDPR